VYSPRPGRAEADIVSEVIESKGTRKVLCMSVLMGIASHRGAALTVPATDASSRTNNTVYVGKLAYNVRRTITSKRNGTLFSAKQNFGWQLSICSRGQGGWKAVIDQTPRNAQVTKAYWSPLHENIQSCQPKSGFPQKRVPFLLLMIVRG